MQSAKDVAKLLPRVEAVEWWYDGLNGKIIPWTLENGGTSHDPSAQAFLVGRDGKVVSRIEDRSTYTAGAFAKWLEDEVRTYEAAHPATLVPLIRAEVTTEGACAAYAVAKAAERPMLLYFGRDSAPKDDRKALAQVKKSARLEKSAFQSKSTAKAAEGWTLLRFDLADEAHAAFARRAFGVEEAPEVILLVPGEEPNELGARVRSSTLTYHFKKHAPKSEAADEESDD